MSSTPAHSHNPLDAHDALAHEGDTVESVIPLMPVVLPIAGGVLMFLLAFIAISMA